MNLEEHKIYKALILLITLISTIALFGTIVEPDGALYASLAKEIALSNDWINLHNRGLDWLDKPHLPFWLSAISFKIFGINSFAYKLPSFLAGLLGAWYTYKMGKTLSNQKTGLVAALITLTAFHVLTSTFDVRAEIYLMTFTFAAIYHYYQAENKSFWHVVAGSLFAALAIMVKGIFVLITVFAGFFIYWILTKQYKQFLKWKWWLAIVLILIFIIPELYTLYIQFDLHPEKVMFGKTNVSGLKFFFWDSQFGRFFNNGPIKGKGDLSFFIHTTAWAFLPWSILFFAGFVNLFKKQNRIELKPENIIIWGSAATTFLIFSLSKFQLPHYILIIFPQFAIITSQYVLKLEGKALSIFYKVQNVIYVLIIFLLVAIANIFEFESKLICIMILLAVLAISFVLFTEANAKTLVARGAVIAIGIMCFLSVFFYPAILKYQSGSEAARWINANYPKSNKAVLIHGDSFSYDFYADTDVKYFWTYEDLKSSNPKNLVIYTPETELAKLKGDFNVEILKTFEYYHTTKLTLKFLNAKTRNQVLENFYLVKIN
jgi:4-amino-4-deoxy-L-arabinose transferase-like glycosyltransferase